MHTCTQGLHTLRDGLHRGLMLVTHSNEVEELRRIDCAAAAWLGCSVFTALKVEGPLDSRGSASSARLLLQASTHVGVIRRQASKARAVMEPDMEVTEDYCAHYAVLACSPPWLWQTAHHTSRLRAMPESTRAS